MSPVGVNKVAKERWIKNRCITYWNGVHKARQARELILEPSIERANCILNLRKRHIRIVTMLLTGHGIFKYHLLNMSITEDKSCRFSEDDLSKICIPEMAIF